MTNQVPVSGFFQSQNPYYIPNMPIDRVPKRSDFCMWLVIIVENKSIEVPSCSSASSVRPESLILEEINEVLNQILIEQINTESSEEEDKTP